MKKAVAKNSYLKNLIYISSFFIFSVSSQAQTGGAIYEVGPQMARAKLYPNSTVLDNGKVISFGGREFNFISCSYADVYDPITNTFTEMPMNYPHDAFASVKLTDGRYFILGGGADLGVAPGYSSTEMYNPKTNTFIAKASMTRGRMQLAATQLKNGKVLVVGGWYNNAGAEFGEIYDTAANTFTATGGLNEPRAYPIVLPTNDGGAVVAGGWPTYGGNTFKSVEYYNTTLNKFEELTSELIPSDEGWILSPIYTRPIEDSKMSNGNYLLMAYRNNPSTEYALIMFNPSDKKFSRLTTSAPIIDKYTDGGFLDLVLNKIDNRAFIMGVDSGSNPQKLSLVTVNLGNGEIYHSGNSYTLPAQEFFYSAMTYIPSKGKILVQGINSTNTSYFTGTNKTYLVTPQFNLGIKEQWKSSLQNIRSFPNPVKDQLTIEINLPEPGNVKIVLLDLTGREILKDVKDQKSSGILNLTYTTSNIPDGIYKLFLDSNNMFYTQTIIIKK